ncbi:MAG: POTRA domain-containing protein, partial [Sphingomicrobium sp.]
MRQAARFALLGSGLLASTAGAQTAPTQPLAPTREEIQRALPTTRAPAANLVVEGELERPPCALDNPEFADIRFTLREVDFAGLGSVDRAVVRPSFAALVGTEQKVSAVCQIRDRAADLLREAGYIAAVQVPEQSIAEGRVRFTVVLARLTDIRVRGDAGRAEKLIAGYLAQLKAQPVFNRFEAERYLLLASDLPGYSVRLALRPATGGAPGDAVGEVTVARVAFAMDANVQNYGSRDLGRYGGQVRAQLFGLTGMGDVTSLSAFATSNPSEQRTLSATHDFRVGAEGLTVLSSASYSWARPDIPGSNTVKARTFVGSLALGYPFIRRQSVKLRGVAGLELINQIVRDDGDALSRDRLRVAFARLDHDASSSDFHRPGFSIDEPVWRTALSVELRHGLGILGATSRCGNACVTSGGIPLSREGADPTTGLIRGSAIAEYRPVPNFTIAVGARGQYASRSLPSYEQFAAGNYSIGR